MYAPAHNPAGTINAAHFKFPYPSCAFDLVILSSVLTHMRSEAIETYLRESARVLRQDASAFLSVFLFDETGAEAVTRRTTIFDFRHRIGPCLTIDADCAEEGIACDAAWFFEEINRAGLRLANVRRGNWREVHSCAVTQDYVVATKR